MAEVEVLWVGLTGGIACGKSTVAKIIRKVGIPVIDADELARKVVEPGSPGLKTLVRVFGPDILMQGVLKQDALKQDALKQEGVLNRKALGEVVFSDEIKKNQLESILHPLIRDEVLRQKKELEAKGCLLAFYDVPLLYEKSMEKDFDQIVVVSCSSFLQEKRMKERDQLSSDQIKKRLRAQIPLLEKEKRAHIVIRNEGDLQDLQTQVEALLNQFYFG